MKFPAILLAISLLVPLGQVWPAGLPSLTMLQKRMLVKADFIGGPRLAGIIYQESSACLQVHSVIDPLACGCSGLHADTASYVVGSKVACSFLDIDWDFSIRVANLYLQKCTELFGYLPALSCYNVGIPKARTMTRTELLHTDYLKTIEHRMSELRQLPKDTE
jgi:hypothetical protein